MPQSRVVVSSRRWALRAAVSVVIGVITSLAIAIVLHHMVAPASSAVLHESVEFDTVDLRYSRRRVFAYDRIEFYSVDDSGLSKWTLSEFRRRFGDALKANGVSDDELGIPAWMPWDAVCAPDVGQFAVSAAGWPSRCLSSHASFVPGTSRGINAFRLRLSSWERWLEGDNRINWRGLFLDTALFGLLAFLLFFVTPDAIHVRRRRRRGLCPACGYDLLHDFEKGCSECGWNRAVEMSRM